MQLQQNVSYQLNLEKKSIFCACNITKTLYLENVINGTRNCKNFLWEKCV